MTKRVAKPNITGRPTVMTQETISKLELAFSYGCTDREACLHAGISTQTLYDYQKIHPDFVDRKAALKENPVLLARQAIVQAIQGDKNAGKDPDVNTAKWYMERKRKDEFSTNTNIDLSANGLPFKIEFVKMDNNGKPTDTTKTVS